LKEKRFRELCLPVTQLCQGGWKRRDVKSCRKIIAEKNKKTETNAYYDEKSAAPVQ